MKLFDIKIDTIQIAPRHRDSWKTYKVTEDVDKKRCEIARLGYTESQTPIYAVYSFLLGVILFLAIDYFDLPSMKMFGYFCFGFSIFSMTFFAVAHRNRSMLIKSISNDDRMQIRSVLSIKADADCFLFGDSGVYLSFFFRGRRMF